MPTFLLTWNSNSSKSKWESLADDVEAVRNGESRDEGRRWSVGVRKSGIAPGDRFFMLRQGPEPRGIMASGRIESDVYEDSHWDDPARTANYVDITFDALIDPAEEPDRLVPMRELLQRFGERFKRVQSSGQIIPDDVADELEQMWTERVGERHEGEEEDEDQPDEEGDDDYEPLPEQVSDEERFVEGAVRSISVNAYERSAAARRACVKHWGACCCVCDFDFEQVYGEIGKDYIHVHHLAALADIGEEYEVDPIKDLRPVCPNCHAMIHSQEPPLTVKRLRQIVRRNRA